MQTTDHTRAHRYTVLAKHAHEYRADLEIKRSNFLGFALRVENETQAREFITSLRKRYHDARHVCSAFVIGADRDIQRSSDDGEPAGTAGIPMLQAILARDTAQKAPISDICVVVVRYFGGIKLGAGGLTRAYSEAVTHVLDSSEFLLRQKLLCAKLPVSHAFVGQRDHEIRHLGFHIIDTEYDAEKAYMSVGVTAEKVEYLKECIAHISAGEESLSWDGSIWVDTP
ncbi:IMPACT family protein [Rothia sp. P6271]|uniref:IMPACT family protein n=1 Tax=unclassified Rothia (in: high G+C Gram-positive bacteria) TaxID=2689056 RepID=UPI003AC4DE55